MGRRVRTGLSRLKFVVIQCSRNPCFAGHAPACASESGACVSEAGVRVCLWDRFSRDAHTPRPPIVSFMGGQSKFCDWKNICRCDFSPPEKQETALRAERAWRSRSAPCGQSQPFVRGALGVRCQAAAMAPRAVVGSVGCTSHRLGAPCLPFPHVDASPDLLNLVTLPAGPGGGDWDWVALLC